MLYLISAVLMLFVVILCAEQKTEAILSFQISTGTDAESISLWKQGGGRCYVFLPAYAKLEDVTIRLHTDVPISLNGLELKSEMDCASFSEEKPYVLSYKAWGKDKQEELVFLRSANVATMYIETQSGTMDYIHREKGSKECGTVTLYWPDGKMAYFGKAESIQGRGNVTWTDFAKKPYSLKLSEPSDLLNLGKAQKWVLLANADDPSNLRNKIVYDFADHVGLRYAPDSDWVDLYLNGEYEGLYLLSERNEVHPERVNISEKGSFLVSMEKRDRVIVQNYPYISTVAAQYLRVHDPVDPSPDQLQELEKTWQSVESAILADEDVDPVTGKSWMEQIDLDSWVKKYLIEEIFGNVDACFISQFFYCDGNDVEQKIYAGPVWDYDHAMGSESQWQLLAPNTLYGNRYHMRDGFDTPWFHALYQKEAFYERMMELYQQDFLPRLNGFLSGDMKIYCEQIAQAHRLNQVRWNLGEVDIYEKAKYLQTFLSERIAFLNRIWIDQMPYYLVKVDNASGGIYGYYAVFPGEKLSALPVLDDTEISEFLGWYDSDTDEPVSPDSPIYRDVAIYAKWHNKYLLNIGWIVKRIPLLTLGIIFLILLIFDLKRNRTGKSWE